MQNKKQNDSINLLDLFFYLLSKWKWFFLYAIIGVLVAYAIYSATGFTYFCSATIAIKDPENKNVSAYALWMHRHRQTSPRNPNRK